MIINYPISFSIFFFFLKIYEFLLYKTPQVWAFAAEMNEWIFAKLIGKRNRAYSIAESGQSEIKAPTGIKENSKRFSVLLSVISITRVMFFMRRWSVFLGRGKFLFSVYDRSGLMIRKKNVNTTGVRGGNKIPSVCVRIGMISKWKYSFPNILSYSF